MVMQKCRMTAIPALLKQTPCEWCSGLVQYASPLAINSVLRHSYCDLESGRPGPANPAWENDAPAANLFATDMIISIETGNSAHLPALNSPAGSDAVIWMRVVSTEFFPRPWKEDSRTRSTIFSFGNIAMIHAARHTPLRQAANSFHGTAGINQDAANRATRTPVIRLFNNGIQIRSVIIKSQPCLRLGFCLYFWKACAVNPSVELRAA